MSADAKNADVDRDQRVNERGELKSPISSRENDQADDGRKNFQPPGEAIVRMNSRPNKNDRSAKQQRDVRLFHFGFGDVTNSTAKLIAAIMLSGLAVPFPAISNAVP
jgi:hypothetical protein